MLNIPQNSVYNIVKRAKEHEYDFMVNPRIEHEHVASKERSGRPKVVTKRLRPQPLQVLPRIVLVVKSLLIVLFYVF